MNMRNLLLMLSLASAWLSAPFVQADENTQVEQGQKLYKRWCAICHARGPGNPGTQALEFRYQGAIPGALEDRDGMTPEFVAYYVRYGTSIMPFYRKTVISDTELAAIGAYLAHNRKKH